MKWDFFISYAAADRRWAEWIAWQLEAAGYHTFLQVWDFRPGDNFVVGINRAVEDANRLLIVLSQSYLASSYSMAEWTAVLSQDPSAGRDRLLVVRIDDAEPPDLLSTRLYIDLRDTDEDLARERLLAGIQPGRAKPRVAPTFPLGSSPRAIKEDEVITELFKFDVFICHNSADKIAAKKLSLDLKERGVRPWFDQWEIAPGTDWQGALEEQIRSIRSAAVLVGSSGFGPWQDLEKKAFLQQFLSRASPVIPVILSGYKGELELPPFLSMLQYVDFREPDPDPMEQLIWGITGKRPE